jgi:tetratricopeptide (TPR) repeat protein
MLLELVKVVCRQVGLRHVLISAALLWMYASICLYSGIIVWSNTNKSYNAALVMVAGFLGGWRMRVFDLVGLAAFAKGIVCENSSDSAGARLWFSHSLLLVHGRSLVYEALARVGENSSDVRALLDRILRKEKKLRVSELLTVARCLVRLGELERALGYYDRAYLLGTTDSLKIELAEIYLEAGRPYKSLEVLSGVTTVSMGAHVRFLQARSLRCLDRNQDALKAINGATNLRPCNSDYQLEKGRIAEDLGFRRMALVQYTKSIRIHPMNPEALLSRGLLKWKCGDRAGAAEDLERCVYFDNVQSLACVMVNRWKSGVFWRPEQSVESRIDGGLTVGATAFKLWKGESIRVEIVVATKLTSRSCTLVVLEPFGAGLEARPRKVALDADPRTRSQVVSLEIVGKRSTAVNLGNPWILNVLLVTSESWTNQLMTFDVVDPAEGEIFFVMTNDHEPRLRRECVTGGRPLQLTLNDIANDLVNRVDRATKVADAFKFKWTHMVDAGTAVALSNWAGNKDGRWRRQAEASRTILRSGYAQGHDVQLHLHLSGVPESYFFCYDYDNAQNVLVFNLDRKNSFFPGWQVNSWANVAKRYGRRTDTNSRIGSLVYAQNALSRTFHSAFPAFRTILFRAGQWDLGRDVGEREKSIMALRESGILADSSSAEGYDYHEFKFSFGKPPHKAVYYTRKNNPEESARVLTECGILEVVPILLSRGKHPATPREDPSVVVKAYRSWCSSGRIDSGRHIIMEIEHLAEIDSQTPPTRPGLFWRRDGWVSIKRHLAKLSHCCPKLKPAGSSEAIRAWLDYYTPEILVLLGSPDNCSNAAEGTRRLLFPLILLGDGILAEELRTYRLLVPVPVGNDAAIRSCRLLNNRIPILEMPTIVGNQFPVELALCAANRNEFVLEVDFAVVVKS